jgi:hypothetical protein
MLLGMLRQALDNPTEKLVTPSILSHPRFAASVAGLQPALNMPSQYVGLFPHAVSSAQGGIFRLAKLIAVQALLSGEGQGYIHF